MPGKGDGQEVLIVDGDDKVQRGLARLLGERGLLPTVVASDVRARELLREKHFSAALIDLDTPGPDGGLELLAWLREHVPSTRALVMVSRKTFESALAAFRAGAVDVVLKAPNQVDYLRRRVVEVAAQAQQQAVDRQLFEEVIACHEELLKRLMEQSRRLNELPDPVNSAPRPQEGKASAVLLVEQDGWLGKQVSAVLTATGYTLTTAASGGEGLDRASADRFQIALVRDTLPDLPGSMVVNALKKQSPDTIVVLYSRPGARPGKADVIEGSKTILLVPELRDGQDLVARFDELREAFRRKSDLAAFRQNHYELLKRYADLKQRLQARLHSH
jgi:DNA-binding NtrC family response regulator